MSNKADRKRPRKVFGRAGEPETSALTDERLNVGVSFNGEPPFLMPGDEKVSVVRITCYCGTPVGMVWRVERSLRNLPVLYFVAPPSWLALTSTSSSTGRGRVPTNGNKRS